ncbi:hypothetical protein [Niveibacterium microcysteis]|uniref:Uncharacterized protein n=1 Tax=Niveibacterium microcysteis TaxID=2811415 RepID=A0ABX7M9Y6_9RHOO|nr:hypothetical protein [Niveibacterium microcysteis]QSI78537.1 hypothetical protein JY500_07965 [Niveibacterium microcysteis]
MSYVLQIWEQRLDLAVPTTLFEASQLEEQLSEQRTQQNPKFIELARRLNEQFPVSHDDPDGDDAVSIWAEAPPTGRSDRPVLVLGLNDELLAVAIPAVRRAALALGLVVFDMQAAEAALADGRLLTLPGRAPVDFAAPSPEADAEPSKAEVLAYAQAQLQPLMARYGFVWNAADEAFRQPNTHWWISFYYRDGLCRVGSSWASSALTAFEHYLCEWDTEKFPLTVYRCDMKQFAAHAKLPEAARPDPALFEDLGYRWGVGTQSRMRANMEQLKTYLADAVLPVLDDCQDWFRIDRHTNQHGPDGSLIDRRAGALSIPSLAASFAAYMARNRDFATVVDGVRGIDLLFGRAVALLTTPDTALRFAEAEPLAQSNTAAMPDDAALQGPAQILAHMRDALQPMMAQHDFAWDAARRAFVRHYPDFNHVLSLVCEGWQAPFKFTVHVHVWDSPAYKALLARVKKVDLDYPFLESGLRARLGSFAHYAKVPVPALEKTDHFRLSLQTVDELKACQGVFAAYLADAVLPVLADCADWAGVDRYCNHPPPGVEPFFFETYAPPKKGMVTKCWPAEDECPFGTFSALEYWIDSLKINRYRVGVDSTAKALVAHLAGNPDIADLCEQLEPMSGVYCRLLLVEFQERVRPIVLARTESSGLVE